MCNLETTRRRGPWPALGHSATGKKVYMKIYWYKNIELSNELFKKKIKRN
jgi:hypothetical protein